MMPRTFCITLRQTPERTEAAWRHFDAIGLGVERFYGIHGITAGLYTCHKKPDGWSPSRGHVGLCLSHYMLWVALQYTTEDSWLVLEDDCYFQPDFPGEFARSFASLPPDWQFAYVGGCCQSIGHVVNDRIARGYSMCTHAYLVRRAALPVLLETMQRVDDHIDVALWHRAMPSLRHYLFAPPLARQHTYEGAWQPTIHTE